MGAGKSKSDSAAKMRSQGKVEDLEKAKHYLEYLIENYEEIYAPE